MRAWPDRATSTDPNHGEASSGRLQVVVVPAAVPAQHEDPVGTEGDRVLQRQLEVGVVLGGGVALDGAAGSGDRVDRGWRHRVEVADQLVDPQAEGERQVRPRVRGHYRGVGRHQRPPAGVDRIAPGDHDDGGRSLQRMWALRIASLRWHYPGQVHGSAARPAAWSPSQPGCPELPLRFEMRRYRAALVSACVCLQTGDECTQKQI